MKDSYSVGEIVMSTTGRDKNHIYLIYKIENNRAHLVNGNDKTFNHAKLKNLRHLISKEIIAENISKKLSDNKQVYDAEVYSVLKKFKEQKQGD